MTERDAGRNTGRRRYPGVTLSAAGRRLFSVSRAERSSHNDTDRLRKYLARFGLDWAAVTAPRHSEAPAD